MVAKVISEGLLNMEKTMVVKVITEVKFVFCDWTLLNMEKKKTVVTKVVRKIASFILWANHMRRKDNGCQGYWWNNVGLEALEPWADQKHGNTGCQGD